MRTITVTTQQYNVIEDYVNASLLDMNLMYSDVYNEAFTNDEYSDITSSMSSICWILDNALKRVLGETLYDIFKEAETEAGEYESFCEIDMDTLKKYITIEVR